LCAFAEEIIVEYGYAETINFLVIYQSCFFGNMIIKSISSSGDNFRHMNNRRMDCPMEGLILEDVNKATYLLTALLYAHAAMHLGLASYTHQLFVGKMDLVQRVGFCKSQKRF